MFIHGRVAYHPWDVQTAGPHECDKLVADLGGYNVAILENHGLLACGSTAGAAFNALYNLEVACKVQVDVLASGQEIVMPTDEALARTVAATAEEDFLQGGSAWQAVRRMIEKSDPDCRA